MNSARNNEAAFESWFLGIQVVKNLNLSICNFLPKINTLLVVLSVDFSANLLHMIHPKRAALAERHHGIRVPSLA